MSKLIEKLVGVLLGMLSPEQLRQVADVVLDKVEELVEGSSNPYDDMIILPMCQMIRATFSIPDNDDTGTAACPDGDCDDS